MSNLLHINQINLFNIATWQLNKTIYTMSLSSTLFTCWRRCRYLKIALLLCSEDVATAISLAVLHVDNALPHTTILPYESLDVGISLNSFLCKLKLLMQARDDSQFDYIREILAAIWVCRWFSCPCPSRLTPNWVNFIFHFL